MSDFYPHLRRPQNWFLRAIWWMGQTGEYFHEVCGENHVPGPCRDGLDRNSRGHQRVLRVIDYPPFVALGRLAGVAVVLYGLWVLIT